MGQACFHLSVPCLLSHSPTFSGEEKVFLSKLSSKCVDQTVARTEDTHGVFHHRARNPSLHLLFIFLEVLLIFKIIYMGRGSVHESAGVCGNRGNGPLELELLQVVSCPAWELGTELWSSARTECALQHWPISPASTLASGFSGAFRRAFVLSLR